MNEFKKNKSHWYHSLFFKITICQIVFILLMISATITIMITLERSALREKSYDFIDQMGNKIVSDLGGQISMAESLTTSLANIGEIIGSDEDACRKLIPYVIGYSEGEELIAGGGLWPEPYTFDPQIERRSFFWGRDDTGRLNYYDEYNDPNGLGYHNEEWYVPASVYPAKKAFWSKSYMDPYSYQPMVTCTVPMYREERFVGAATIDLKLEGLRSFFKKEAKLTGGYIFAVDRNNKFLTFPNEELVKTYTPDEKGNIVEEFIHVNELAKVNPSFQIISSVLQDINTEIIENAQKNKAFNQELSEYIDNHSYQIDSEEALLITSVMLDPLKRPLHREHELKRLFLKDDILLKQPVLVSVFHMPKTYWKIITVSPVAVANQEADALTAKVAFFILISESLLLCFMFIFLFKFLIKPIRKMSTDLARISKTPKKLSGRLDESSKDELGNLAYQFNRRTDQLLFVLENLRKTTTSIENLNKEIVDRKKAEEKIMATVQKLDESNLQLKEFTYIASHDLREPIRKISAFGELLSSSLEGKLDSDDAENLTFMIDGARRMQQMIDALLTYSRVTIKEVEFQDVDLNEIVEQLKGLELSVQIEETGTNILQPEQLPVIKGDSAQIRQLLQNIISNGIKYQEKGNVPEIIIRAFEEKDDMVRIEVEDNGIGIKQEQYDAVFVMFRRLNSKQKYQGTGIGMAVCKKIVERHGGQIGIESEEGKGSMFWFTMSVAKVAVHAEILHA